MAPLPGHVIPVYPPPIGLTQCYYTSGGDYYLYPFDVFWHPEALHYGWLAHMSDSAEKSYRSSAVDPKWVTEDTFRFSEALPPDVEVGWGAYLDGVKADNIHTSFGHELDEFGQELRGLPTAWETRTRIGTRISTFPFTSCCFQFMRSLTAGEFAPGAGGFVLTEYCFAAEPEGAASDVARAEATGQSMNVTLASKARAEATRQYLNRTLASVVGEIGEACGVVERATRFTAREAGEGYPSTHSIAYSAEYLAEALTSNASAYDLWTRAAAVQAPGWYDFEGWRIRLMDPWVEIYPYGNARGSGGIGAPSTELRGGAEAPGWKGLQDVPTPPPEALSSPPALWLLAALWVFGMTLFTVFTLSRKVLLASGPEELDCYIEITD